MHRQFCLFAIAVSIAFFSAKNSKAQDASALLDIRVNLIQCGQTQADLPRACREDQRCCVFLDGQQDITIAAAEPDWQETGYSNDNLQYYLKASDYRH